MGLFESLGVLLKILNALTPLGIIGLLATIILLMVHKSGPLQTIKNNHLDHVQGSLDALVANSEKQLTALNDIKTDIAFVKGKID